MKDMIDITLRLNKAKVLEGVAQTTSYTGKKMPEDDDAYERIFTTEEDQSMLSRFWDEAKNAVCQALKRELAEEREDDEGNYSVRLSLSNAFDEALKDSMERSLYSFFVMSITAKWYKFANKPEAADYATEAAGYLEDVKRKAYFKKRPKRPTY